MESKTAKKIKETRNVAVSATILILVCWGFWPVADNAENAVWPRNENL